MHLWSCLTKVSEIKTLFSHNFTAHLLASAQQFTQVIQLIYCYDFKQQNWLTNMFPSTIERNLFISRHLFLISYSESVKSVYKNGVHNSPQKKVLALDRNYPCEASRVKNTFILHWNKRFSRLVLKYSIIKEL